MGQLDEAIRAHLELKRKHGASEEEVHAEEQEALGPVRRETGEPAPEVQASPEPADEYEVDPALDGPGFHEPPIAPPGEDPPEAFHEPVEPLMEPPLDPSLDTAEPPETTELTDDFELDEDAEPAGAGPAQSPAGETPAQGFERVEEAAPDEENEDMLEETPDFLQETPEHDRLWFEQKPPRDFDFDE